MRCRQSHEGILHCGIGQRPQRCMVNLQLRQRVLAVIGAVIDIDHIHSRIEPIDGGQDAVAMQTIRIELSRFEIGGGNQANAILKQRQ